MKHDILFLSKIFPKDIEEKIRKLTKGMQDAANNLQWSIIEGLEKNNSQGTLKLLNQIPIASFPANHNMFMVREHKFSHNNHDTKEDYSIGFCNLRFFRRRQIRNEFAKRVKKWAYESLKKDNPIIISYTFDYNFIYAIKVAKKINPRIKSCCIIADLPQFMTLSKKPNKLVTLYIKHLIKKTNSIKDCINSYVYLTEHMKEVVCSTKPYIVIEGIARDKLTNSSEIKLNWTDDDFVFLYSGTLHYKFGIMELIKAFRLTSNPKLKLVICGYGEAKEEILKNAKEDSRILFLGQLSSSTVTQLQSKATVLVNPRQNIYDFAKYSFPSKNMEYLLSGRPMIGYKLAGIPLEYDKYILYVNGNQISDLTRTMEEVARKSKDELMNIGLDAQNYVMMYKNEIIQTQKILELIGGLYE